MGKILVTGGAGYIGSVLIRRLLEMQKEVVILDKFYFGTEPVEDIKDSIEIIRGDVRDFDVKNLRGVECVVHLAGLSNDPTAEYNPRANREMNLLATERLAKACRESAIERFIFASSCSVYYSLEPDDTPKDENYEVSPTAPYSMTKYKAEEVVLSLADGSFCPVVLRKGTVYGSSPRMRYDLVVNTFTKDAFQKRRLTVHAGGRMWRPLLHIEDAVDAYVTCLLAPVELIRGQIFNVVSENHRILDLAGEVRRVIELRKGVRVDMDVQDVGLARSYVVDGRKFREALGFTSKGEVSDAVSLMWDELEAGKDCTHPIYYNIRWLELLHEMEKRLKVIGSVF